MEGKMRIAKALLTVAFIVATVSFGVAQDNSFDVEKLADTWWWGTWTHQSSISNNMCIKYGNIDSEGKLGGTAEGNGWKTPKVYFSNVVVESAVIDGKPTFVVKFETTALSSYELYLIDKKTMRGSASSAAGNITMELEKNEKKKRRGSC